MSLAVESCRNWSAESISSCWPASSASFRRASLLYSACSFACGTWRAWSVYHRIKVGQTPSALVPRSRRG